MKKKSKLTLGKTTIVKLSVKQQRQVKGGSIICSAVDTCMLPKIMRR